MKPTYDVDRPDQQRLKIARTKIEAVLADHDLAGVVVLHTPGMSEFFYRLTPSYSVCWVDKAAGALRIKSELERDHGGDRQRQQHDHVATANMAAALSDNLQNAAHMFGAIEQLVTKALRAEHTPPTFVPDTGEGKRH